MMTNTRPLLPAACAALLLCGACGNGAPKSPTAPDGQAPSADSSSVDAAPMPIPAAPAPSPDVEFTGTASGFGGICPERQFQIGGNLFVTSLQTTFVQGTCTGLTGTPVLEVKGRRQSNGVIVAGEVHFEDAPDSGEDDHSGGDDPTGDDGHAGGDDGPGHDAGDDNGDNGQDDHGGGGEQQLELKGTVSSLQGSCPSIAFTLAGRAITAGPSTDFRSPCAGIADGSRIEVKGTGAATGPVTATRISLD